MAQSAPRTAGIPAITLATAAVMVMLLAAACDAQATLSCSTVYGDLSPCINYIQAGSGPVPTPCCDGVRSLLSSAKTVADRRAACGCLKTAATQFGTPGIVRIAGGIPAKCSVPIPFKIGATVDCSKVK